MRLGFIVPTSLESLNLSPLNSHVTSAGYGAGKTAVCAAAAELIYNKHCDTIIIWGLAGSLSPAVGVNDILIGTSVAYRDYNIAPLAGSTGVGFVQDFAENIWVDLDKELVELLYRSMQSLFPERRIVRGKICTGDQFVQHNSPEEYNRVEKDAWGVDMESAALVHFCHLLKKEVKVGIVRIISDNADHNADINFTEFLEEFGKLNGKMYAFREKILSENSTLKRLVPFAGNTNSLVASEKLFQEACHKMYDRFLVKNSPAEFCGILAGAGESAHFARQLSEMFSLPFCPAKEEEYKGKKFLLVLDRVEKFSDICAQCEAIRSSGGIITHILSFSAKKELLAEKEEWLKKENLSFMSLLAE